MRVHKYRAWIPSMKLMVPVANFKFVHGDGNYGDIEEITTVAGVFPRHAVNIMEYCGVKDIEKKEIFESDILIINEEDDEWYDSVVWKKNGLELSSFERHLTDICLYNTHDQIRLVGNIYEHHHFLEENS